MYMLFRDSAISTPKLTLTSVTHKPSFQLTHTRMSHSIILYCYIINNSALPGGCNTKGKHSVVALIFLL